MGDIEFHWRLPRSFLHMLQACVDLGSAAGKDMRIFIAVWDSGDVLYHSQ